MLKGESTADDHVESRRLALLLGVGLAVLGVKNIVQIQCE
jgi:hypothetical protein